MRRAQHSSGKRERPTFAGVLGFILLVALPFEVIVPFFFDTVGAHTVGIVLIVGTLVGLEGCCEALEEHEGRHTREDDWSAGVWADDDRFE